MLIGIEFNSLLAIFMDHVKDCPAFTKSFLLIHNATFRRTNFLRLKKGDTILKCHLRQPNYREDRQACGETNILFPNYEVG